MSAAPSNSNPVFGGLSVDSIIAMLKDTLTTDLIPGAPDQSGKAVYVWMFNIMNIIEQYKVKLNTVVAEKDKNLILESLHDEESARRFGSAFSKIDTILATDCGLGGGWFKDSVFATAQLASEMDSQGRDLGKYVREGWNAHKDTIGSNETL